MPENENEGNEAVLSNVFSAGQVTLRHRCKGNVRRKDQEGSAFGAWPAGTGPSLSDVEEPAAKRHLHPVSGVAGEGSKRSGKPVMIHDLRTAPGARRRLRRDIAALVGRIREYLAAAPQLERAQSGPALVNQPAPHVMSLLPEPVTPRATQDERERRQLTDRFGGELKRVLDHAAALGVANRDARRAIEASLASERVLHGAADRLEALARRL